MVVRKRLRGVHIPHVISVLESFHIAITSFRPCGVSGLSSYSTPRSLPSQPWDDDDVG